MNSPDIKDLVARNALFVASHSGGKDSQAQLIYLLAQGIPAKQILVAHATLGDIEWPGALELARDQAAAAGCDFIVAQARFNDGTDKTLEAKVAHQWSRRQDASPFPSKDARFCTSELKTQPIEREVLAYAKPRGYKLIVSCLGIRAAESPARAKKLAWEKHAKYSRAGREGYTWLPIFTLSTAQVFETIKAAGQQPHPAYAAGNKRLSCLFCIFGSQGDIQNGAKARPDVYQRFLALEQLTGKTMHQSRKPLRDIVEGKIKVVADDDFDTQCAA